MIINHNMSALNAQRNLKVANGAEPPAITNFQTEALLHIERSDPGLPVSRVQRTTDGQTEFSLSLGDGLSSIVRMLTFLEGVPLHKVPASRQQRRNLGTCLARLGLVLRDFDHPAADHDLLWDIKNAPRLCPLLPSIADEALREAAERHLQFFERMIAPALPGLRKQVIHNDLNPHNVLVAEDDPECVTGILDFGDMVRTPLVMDIAVASSYHIAGEGHPLEHVVDLVSAYQAVYPLLADEVDLLFDLIITRLVTTIAITNWRATRYPENSTYILRNNPPARAGLARLSTLSRDDARHYLRRACGLE